MTTKEATVLIGELQKVFDIVRLVDVAMTTQYTPDKEGHMTPEAYHCYAVWNKQSRCENCVSARAFAQKTRLTKYEFIDNEVYYVVAKYVEVNGKPYVLEIVSNVTDHILFGALGKDRLIQSIQNYNDALYRDSLTGAYNRKYYEEQLQALQLSDALAMLDVDNFKAVNDTFGHQAGDEALKTLSKMLHDALSVADVIIRYGGDEFLLVFRNTDADSLPAVLETLRENIQNAPIEGYPDLKLTVSIGAATGGVNMAERVSRADKCLYKAKETKNKVCFE